MSSTIRSINCSIPEKAAGLHIPVGHDAVMWFNVVSIPLITLFGIIGNMFSFVILKESALKIASHFYLVCLAISDSLSLLSVIYTFYTNLSLQPILLKFTNDVNFIERHLTNHISCPWRLYTSFVLRFISVWTIVIFSIDRFLVVMFPMKSGRISTVKNAAIGFGCLVTTSILFNIPWLFSFDQIPKCHGRTLCKGNRVLFIFRFVETIFFSILPSIVICFCNISIVFLLRRRQKHSTLYSKQSASSQEKLITIRLLLVSTAFVVLTLPSLIIISIHTENKLRHDYSFQHGIKADVFQIGIFLFSVNLSINFVLYCLTGVTFRKAAWNLLCCRLGEMRHYRRVIVQDSTGQTNLTNPSQRGSLCSDKNRIINDSSTMSPLLESNINMKLTVSPASNNINVRRWNSDAKSSSVVLSNSSVRRNNSDRPLLVTPI